jgi:hypothetical protein
MHDRRLIAGCYLRGKAPRFAEQISELELAAPSPTICQSSNEYDLVAYQHYRIQIVIGDCFCWPPDHQVDFAGPKLTFQHIEARLGDVIGDAWIFAIKGLDNRGYYSRS